jgi:hypothetical protein
MRANAILSGFGAFFFLFLLFCPDLENGSHKRTKTNLKNGFFLPNTDKYLAVFTKYLVAEYSAGHYSAERIVGRSLPSTSISLILEQYGPEAATVRCVPKACIDEEMVCSSPVRKGHEGS